MTLIRARSSRRPVFLPLENVLACPQGLRHHQRMEQKLISNPFEFGRILEVDLAAFQKKHGLRLPASYRDFLLTTNGGRTVEHSVLARNPAGAFERYAMEMFYAVEGSEDWISFEGQDFEEAISHRLLPIAHDAGNSKLWMALKNEADTTTVFPEGSLFCGYPDFESGFGVHASLMFVAPSLAAYQKMAHFGSRDGIGTPQEFETILENEDLKLLEALRTRGFAINEVVMYGNTLADQALVAGKMKLFDHLIHAGALCPRFHIYAGKLSDPQIQNYIERLACGSKD